MKFRIMPVLVNLYDDVAYLILNLHIKNKLILKIYYVYEEAICLC